MGRFFMGRFILYVLIMVVLGFTQTVVYIDPPRIPAKAVGQQCTLKIRVRNAAGVYGWQSGFFYNSTVLKGVSVTEDSFLRYAHGVYHDDTKIFFGAGSFDSTNKMLKSVYCTILGPDSGGVGDGPLVRVIFNIIGTGSSIFDLTQTNKSSAVETKLSNSDADALSFLCQDGFYGNETITPTSSFSIVSSSLHQIKTAAAWNSNANEFLVSWEEYETATGNSDILGQRVSSSGGLVSNSIPIDNSYLFNTFSPNVNWNGQNYLVAYTSRYIGSVKGTYDIKAITVSGAGIPGTEFVVCSAPGIKVSQQLPGTAQIILWSGRIIGLIQPGDILIFTDRGLIVMGLLLTPTF